MDGEDLGDASAALPHPYLLQRVQDPSLPGPPPLGMVSPDAQRRLWGTPCGAWRGAGEERGPGWSLAVPW